VADKDLTDEQVTEELELLLQELRIALPGVQILFAFLLTVPFATGFEKGTPAQKDAYLVALLCTLVSSVFLIAPTSYHRLRFRHHDDPDKMMRRANMFAIVGLAFLAMALTASIFLVGDYLFDRGVAIGLTAAAAVLIALVWYAIPLSRYLDTR